MHKCLFVSQRIGISNTGAAVCSERNLHHCRELFTTEGTEVYRILKGRVPGPVRKVLQVFGFVDGLLPRDVKEITAKVINGGFDLVFLDTSCFGLVAKALVKKCPAVKIAVFYMDVLVHWWRSAQSGPLLRKRLLARVFRRVEGMSTRAADIRIFLTDRDRTILKKEYGAEGGFLVPISVPDRFDSKRSAKSYASKAERERVLLFVGVDYRPNVEGVSWFIERILPFIRSSLRIVGKGMERHRHIWKRDRVEVPGRVEDLDEEYMRADAVVIPLLSGSGMKIKTVEALMFGKRIFGTPEAFVGLDLDFSAVGALCQSEREFISAIGAWERGALDPDGVNPASRAAFAAGYSFDATLKAMRRALSMD